VTTVGIEPCNLCLTVWVFTITPQIPYELLRKLKLFKQKNILCKNLSSICILIDFFYLVPILNEKNKKYVLFESLFTDVSNLFIHIIIIIIIIIIMTSAKGKVHNLDQ